MTIEITIDGPRNDNLRFPPLQRTLRGTFDLNRVNEPLARMKYTEFPRPIPGLVIVVDAEKKTGEIRDPLHDAEHAAIREKIQSMSMKLGPAVERFENIDANTWLFWMRRAVASGTCKIVSGKFPAIDEKKARKDFIMPEVVDQRDTLIRQLIALQYAALPADAQKKFDAIMAGG